MFFVSFNLDKVENKEKTPKNNHNRDLKIIEFNPETGME